MNSIPEGRQLDVFWEDLFYLNARLKSNPMTAGLAVSVEEQLATFDELLREDRAVRGALLMSQVRGKAAEEQIKDEVLDLYMLALVEVKKKRKDERYSKLIKVNESTFVRYNFTAQRAEVLRMKSVLKQTIYEDAFRDRLNAILDRILSVIDVALAVELEANERRAQHRVDVNEWKAATNKLRTAVYGELINISGDENTTWPRSFFPKATAAKKLSAEDAAALEAKRAKKRADKAEKDLNIKKARLAKAEKKAQAEKEKAEVDARMKAGGGAVVPDPVPDPVPNPVPNPVPVPGRVEEPA